MKGKPFFYRLDAAEFFAVVREIPNKDCAKWLKTFASDLVSGNSENEYTLSLINEVKKYREIKSLAGKKGMESRYQTPNTVITELQQNPNTVITNSSNSNNNRSSNIEPKTLKPKSKEESKPPIIPLKLFPICQAWKDYLEMRKTIKKPITENGKLLAIKKLISLQTQGNDPIAVLEQSILNSWQGLFAVKPEATTTYISKDEARRQRNHEASRRLLERL